MKVLLLLPFGLVLGLIIFGIVVYPTGDSIKIGERSMVEEPRSTMEILQQNTPVQFRLLGDRWGSTAITSPSKLYELWSTLERLELRTDAAVVGDEYTEGLLEFFDGSQRRYRISHRFQLEDFVLSSGESSQDGPDLFAALMYVLQTKATLMDVIRQANQITGYADGQPLSNGDAPGVLHLGDQDRRVLLDRLAQSERIIDMAELDSFLAIYGDNPFYHIALPVANGSGEPQISMSVLSYSYFYVTDLRYEHDNVIFFRGNLLQFMEERLF